MRPEHNPEARRPIVRTYEGVQWFKHQGSTEAIPAHVGKVWLSPIPGTNAAFYRFGDRNRVSLVIWNGDFWTSSGTTIIKELTALRTTSRDFPSVKAASQWAYVARSEIVSKLDVLKDIHPSWNLKVKA